MVYANRTGVAPQIQEDYNVILRTLRRFPNLRIFKIDFPDSPDIDLNIIKNWTRLEQLTITNPRYNEI